jgi:hypothetical protein
VGGVCGEECGTLRAVEQVQSSRNKARAFWAARFFFAARGEANTEILSYAQNDDLKHNDDLKQLDDDTNH